MAKNPHNPQGQTLGAETGELTLPLLSEERKRTLESMSTRINEFGQHLFNACTVFRNASTQPPGSLDAKSSIHQAKEQVESALHNLDSILRLIDLDPARVSHIATHIRRASGKLKQIERVSDQILKSETPTHHRSGLQTLSRACFRASYELENSLWVPLREALSPANDQDPPPPSAISA
ncbi:MAG: hypothetical protein RL518_99 [Pseudomonadota bacterium]|jgi:enamine deaminase RidA (YjgF/YER057c/UK114 family)